MSITCYLQSAYLSDLNKQPLKIIMCHWDHPSWIRSRSSR